MKYSDFIKGCFSKSNTIDWNYYPDINKEINPLDARGAKDFIKDYFDQGHKIIPLILDSDE